MYVCLLSSWSPSKLRDGHRWPMPGNWSMRSPSSTVLNESACLRKASMQSVDDKAPVPTASNLGSIVLSSDFQHQTTDWISLRRERQLFTHSIAAPRRCVCLCHSYPFPTSPAPSIPGTSERASKALGIWPQRAFVPPLGSLAEQSPEDPPQLRRTYITALNMLQIFADFKSCCEIL